MLKLQTESVPLLSRVPSRSHHLLDIAHTLHLLRSELPGAEAILAPGSGQHLLEQHIGGLHTVGGHHLPPICSQLLKTEYSCKILKKNT